MKIFTHYFNYKFLTRYILWTMSLAVYQFLYLVKYLNKHFLALPIKCNTPPIVTGNIKWNVLNIDGSHHSIYDKKSIII